MSMQDDPRMQAVPTDDAVEAGEEHESVHEHEHDAPKAGSWMTTLVGVVLLVVIVGGAYMFGRALRFTQPFASPPVNRTLVQAPVNMAPPIIEQNQNATLSPPPQQTAPGAQNWGWYGNDADLAKIHVTKVANDSGLVQWQDPKLTTDGDWLHTNSQPEHFAEVDFQTIGKYIRNGTFLKGTYAGKGLYATVIVYCTKDDNCDTPDSTEHTLILRYIVDGTKIILLSHLSPPNVTPANLAPAKALAERNGFTLSVDGTFDIPELHFPAKVVVQKTTLAFSLGEQEGSISYNEYGLQDSPTPSVLFTDPVLGPADSIGDNNVVFHAADGSTVQYIGPPPSIAKTINKDVAWNDGTKNTNDYQSPRGSGCGIQLSYSFDQNVTDADLTQIGRLINGDFIYGLSSSDDPSLHNIYDGLYFVPPGEKKMTYDEFVASHPLIYWKDELGRWVQFEDSRYQTGAECGKPVIYLYPTQHRAVSVRIAPTGGMTKSDPAYGSGWNVIADPNGSLTDAASGKPYPYLFWEGRSNMVWTLPTTGFNVAQADVSRFLDRTLAQLGLNAKESADFKTFWLPRFTGHPYYFVTFSGNSLMDKVAPLTVTPKPDTVIRILMDFKGEDAPIDAPEPHWNRPARNGFTVIEWGGVIR